MTSCHIMKTIQVKNPITEAQEQHKHPKREWLLFGHVFFYFSLTAKHVFTSKINPRTQFALIQNARFPFCIILLNVSEILLHFAKANYANFAHI